MGVDATTQTFIDRYSGVRNRVAFPGYRVFVFGYEITDDVIETRISHSGGSVERSAGTCSFSIVNPNNKYTLNYGDMLYISKSIHDYKEFRTNQWKFYGVDGSTTEDVKALLTALGEGSLDRANMNYDETFDYLVSGTFPSGESGGLSASSVQANQDAEVEQQKVIDAEYQGVADKLSEYSKAHPFSATRLGGFPAKAYGADSIKAQVIEEKLRFTSDITYNPDSNLNKLENRTILNYPMQQGDCIFHPNDPVRIAYRDPFDPRIWYWMFTGFVDAWTETQGENRDSILTINCTDVTKMARYTYIQLGVGLADPNIENIVSSLREESGAGIQFFKELFAFFTMQEVLETLFFGTVSAKSFSEDAIKSQIQGMSPEALNQYLETHFSEYIDPESMKHKASPEDRYTAATIAAVEKRKELLSRAGRLAPISVPAPYMQGVSKGSAAGYTVFQVTETGDALGGGTDKNGKSINTAQSWDRDILYDDTSPFIIAKRRDSTQGVRALFYGDVSKEDLVLGEKLESLAWYNEVLHHRVRDRDLMDMALDPGAFAGDFSSRPASTIIDIIGKNKTKFPVGHGRVFYTSRSRFSDGDLGRQIIDRAMGMSGSLFSTFKDMLSYIYDMAERVDFRFYATPKGDFVFELPFYDFNPSDFISDTTEKSEWQTGQVSSKLYDPKELSFSSLDLEAIGFSRNYSEETEANELLDTGKYDYASCFTIERDEQCGFSNTFTDNGVFTVFRCKPKLIASYSGMEGGDITQHVWVPEKGGIPMLGVRVTDTDTWGFITSKEEAEAFAALTMARVNAEAKNVSVSTLPKFGLMVNRPIFWRERNYYGNIVSLNHSVVWNSSADTTVNMNSLRGWGGEIDANGYPIHRHFSGTDLPFSMGEMTKQSNKTKDTK
jgi:hypothetical protein